MAVRGPMWLRGETGTGKTLTSIKACILGLERLEGPGRVLVVVPERMLMEKWCAEIEMLDREPFLLGGKKDVQKLFDMAESDRPEWVVVSYNALSFSAGDGVRAMTGSFTHIIFDESQKAKSPGSKRVRKWKKFVKANFVKILKERPAVRDHLKVLMLSATPLIHNAIDLITQYQVSGVGGELDEAGIMDYEVKEIAQGVEVRIPLGWNEDAIKRGQVAKVLGRRRTELLQADVFPADLPPMIEERWELDLGSEDDLHAALMGQAVRPDDSDDLIEQWGDVLRMAIAGEQGMDFWESLHVLASSLRYERKLRCKADTMPMMIWGLFLRAEGLRIVGAVHERLMDLGRQAVVFANHKEPLYRLRDAMGDVPNALYTGAQSPGQAREAKADLRAGRVDFLLATYQKGGVGVEFTPTPVVVLAQRSPSPADMEQAKARIYRLNSVGQTWAYTCVGRLNGEVTRLEHSLSSIIERKQGEAAIAGLAGTLG